MRLTRRFLAAVVLACLPVVSHAATGTVAPMPKALCLDNNGAIVNGGLIFTYTAGTTTKLTTYSDAALTTPNANPVVCDSAGRATIFLSASAYKFTYAPSTDTDPPTNAYFTVDNIAAVPYLTTDLDITGTAGEALSAGDAVYVSDGSGGNTAGRWYKTDADNTYSSTTAQAIGFAVADIASAANGSIRIQGKVTGLAGLAAGTVYYISATAGALTSTAPTNQRAVGVADSGTTLVIAFNTPPASTTQSGVVTTSAQSFAGVKTFTSGLTSNSQQATTALLGGTTESLKLGGLLTTDGTDYAITGVAVMTDTGWTYSIDAAALTTGNVIEVTVFGTSAGNVNIARQVQVSFGGTAVYVINQARANASSGNWYGTASIIITGASAQRLAGNGYLTDAVNDVSNTPDYQTAAVALSGAITLKTRVNPANAGETITQKGVIVKVF